MVERHGARERRFGVVHRVDVALLGQHRLTIGRHQQRPKRMPPHGRGALRHRIRAPQVANNLVWGHPWLPLWAQPVVCFSIQLNSSYITMAMMPTTSRPENAKPICIELPAEISR